MTEPQNGTYTTCINGFYITYEYKNGKKDGYFSAIRNGILLKKGFYKDDKRDGVWQSYFEDNGRIRFQETFNNGVRVDKVYIYKKNESSKPIEMDCEKYKSIFL